MIDLRELIAKWRYTADRSLLGPTQLTEYASKRLCADELEAALASAVEHGSYGYVEGFEAGKAQAFEEAAKMCDDRGFEILAEKLRALAQAKVKK